ncbi:MAG: hypothetical protein ACRDPC_24370, partial [Solirubrobacteraceae bacterium]
MSSLRAFALLLFASLLLPTAAAAQSRTGGSQYAPPPPPAPENMTVPGVEAQLLPDGTAAAPADAPPQVQEAVWAANRLQDKPYRYGGGHAKIEDSGYDCSGTISYALHHAGLLKTPLDSGSFMRWGEKGRGQWITVFTNPGHAYAVIAGLRLDTSSYGVATRRRSSRRVVRSALERG